MINSTNTLNIDGTSLNDESIKRLLNTNNQDTFSRWVLRPIAFLSVAAIGVAVLFASAFFIVISLALVPLAALSLWAVKKKIQREQASTDPVVDTQTDVRVDAADEAASVAS